MSSCSNVCTKKNQKTVGHSCHVCEHTWSSDINIHAIILYFSLRRCRSDRCHPEVSCIQMLLRPFPLVSLISQIQHGLLLKLKNSNKSQQVSMCGISHQNSLISDLQWKKKHFFLTPKCLQSGSSSPHSFWLSSIRLMSTFFIGLLNKWWKAV